MSDQPKDDEQKRDEVLKRMLETPPEPRKPALKKKEKEKRKARAKAAEGKTELPVD